MLTTLTRRAAVDLEAGAKEQQTTHATKMDSVESVEALDDHTVQFTLKLFATGVVLFVLLPWMLSVSVGFGPVQLESA